MIDSNIKGYVIAGTHSGCGKTTVTLSLLAWLKRNRYNTAPFKIGPDFIDPGHHKTITGNVSRNLDGWMLTQDYNLENFSSSSQNYDVAIVEGVMGLFDGFSGKDESGSTAQMAKWLDLPVILVVNAKSMARSAAALIQGFENFDPDLQFAGVIFNQVGSKSHLNYLTEALDGKVNMPCLGGIPKEETILIPERHLGLVTQEEHLISKAQIDFLADSVEKHLDTKKLFNSLAHQNLESKKSRSVHRHLPVKAKPRIGVARDKAFCFYYRENLELLEYFGARIILFSPMDDPALPENLDAVYFGGGYPELFAESLSENTGMLDSVKAASVNNMPIFAECGGFMYLCNTLQTINNESFNMTGCFPFKIKMLNRLNALGYRQVTFSSDTFLGKKGVQAKGHEFHYSQIEPGSFDIDTSFLVKSGKQSTPFKEGYRNRNTLGGYIHFHFGSNPDLAKNFVHSAAGYKDVKSK